VSKRSSAAIVARRKHISTVSAIALAVGLSLASTASKAQQDAPG